MKRKITNYLFLTIVMLITLPIFAPMKYSWNPSDGTTQVGFNLQNISDYLIQFQIYNESAGAYHRHVFEIEPNGEYGIALNINVQTKLKIYQCPGEAFSLCTELTLPKANIIETTFPLGKTIYINWDGKELLPQHEATAYQTTKAGYYLTNNVQPTDYTLTEIKTGNKTYPKEIGRDPWELFPKAQDYIKTQKLREAEMYTDATVSKFVLGVNATPTDTEINRAWETISAQWNPDDHQDEPDFARAVMKIINRSRNNLFDPIIKISQ